MYSTYELVSLPTLTDPKEAKFIMVLTMRVRRLCVRNIEKMINILNSIAVETAQFLKYCHLEYLLVKTNTINLNLNIMK